MQQPIRLYWYRSGKGRRRVNFGDDLSPMLVGLLSGREVHHAPPHLADLLSAGSILQHLGRNLRKPRCWLDRVRARRLSPIHVWGSGAFGPTDMPFRSLLAIHALRGPMTRDAIRAPSDLPLGDPGLLVDHLDLPRVPKVRWGIVAHMDDANEAGAGLLCEVLAPVRRPDLTDPDIPGVAAGIRACDFVISSSLHGLVVADAFGIPSVWMSLRDGFYGGEWKFHDYFAAVGRSVAGPLRVRSGEPLPDRAELEALATTADATSVEAAKAALLAAFARMSL